MKILATKSNDVVRVSRQFGFKNLSAEVTAVTFSGRTKRYGEMETFVVNKPTQGWNRKDGSVTISNRAASWGWRSNADAGAAKVTVFDFQPETIRTADGNLCVWQHNG